MSTYSAGVCWLCCGTGAVSPGLTLPDVLCPLCFGSGIAPKWEVIIPGPEEAMREKHG